MDDLALQIGFVDGVEVDYAERPYASRGEIEQRRATQTPGSDHQHACVLQPLLAVHSDIGNDQMTAVAAYLVDGQLIGGLYQRRQGHGFLQLKGAARYRRRQTFSILIVTRVRRPLFRMMG
jgi:hypothetical protein